jgi:hypothetical protein
MKAAFLLIAFGAHAIDDCRYARIAAQEMNCPLPQTSSCCCSLPEIECEQGRMIELSISHNGCSGIISASLGKITQLRTLLI